MKYFLLFIYAFSLLQSTHAADTFVPYTAETVPKNVTDLWKDIDPRKEALETEVVEEWEEDGIICRYVIFKIGTFKGADARLAAFYTFPKGMKNGAAFVWSHGGGQRAERERGAYFAKHGFATVDINWGGREIVEGIKTNTDWGKVDPSQGPRFYPNAKRKSTKSNLLPDEHTIDPVSSPRNGNWFQLAYAGRRAITFLEQQPEVDPARIGFTGYSMGGTITSIVSIDSRLKAVIPMVGGCGYRLDDFAGLPGTGRARAFKNIALYNSTVDPHAYWAHVKAPVLFLSATDDFHSTFEKIYLAMNLIPHDDWRVSQMMHYNHSLGAEQWILINRFFDHHLKGKGNSLPKTAKPRLVVKGDAASFSVTPTELSGLNGATIYYSHDPNPRSRFWKRAASQRSGNTWRADLPVRKRLPLYAFANFEYDLGGKMEAFRGEAETFTLTSDEAVHVPAVINVDLLHAEAREVKVFEDFEKNGVSDWGLSTRGGIQTYKFQDPDRKIPEASMALKVQIDAPRGRLSFRLRLKKNNYLTGVKEPSESLFFTKQIAKAGRHEFLVRAGNFVDREKEPMSDWKNIQTITVDIYDGEAKSSLHFNNPENIKILSRMEWVTP